MPLTKVTPPNLHQTVKTMVTTMVNETAVDSADVVTLINANAIDSADANSLFDTRLATKDTGDLSEGSNLYYTDTRADARIAAATTADLTEGSNLYYTTARGDSDTGVYIAGNRTYGNITTTGYIAGPATMTIDPAAVGDNTGTLVVAGNLQVDGTTTTINSTTLEVEDKNVVLGPNAANDAANNGAGLTVTQPDTSNATLIYDTTSTQWEFNKALSVPSINTTGDITFGDNDKAIFGAGSDLQIWHDGSNTLLYNTTGNNYFRSNRFAFSNTNGTLMADMYSGGRVDLHFSGSKKFETTSTGVTVTGTVTADGLTVDASSPTIFFKPSANTETGYITFNNTSGSARGFMKYNYSNDSMSWRTAGISDRMTIDASGNLLVGTTAATAYNNSTNVYGFNVYANGQIASSVNNAQAAYFNRQNGDGTILDLRKDGSTVGNIGAVSDDLYIHTGDTGLRFNDGNDQIWPVSSGGSSRDNAISLGGGTIRFKDLYLSGKITNDGSGGISIDADGKVGIGTAQPDLTLHVDGVNGYPATSGSTPVGHIAIRAKNESSSHGANIGVANASPWGTWIQAQDAGNLATSYPISLNPNGGNVGIGTTSPSVNLEVSDSSNPFILVKNTTSGSGLYIKADNDGDTELQTAGGNNNIVLRTAGNERMEIDSLGNLAFGSGGYQPGNGNTNTGIGFRAVNTATSVMLSVSRTDGNAVRLNYNGVGTSGGDVLNWSYNGGGVGSVAVDSNGTTYNTTSDRRLKDNITTITNGKEKLLAMNPVTHTWKADPEADAVHGFIAQEMQEVVPEAVSGDPDSDKMMSMDYGRITPVIVAALQDALKEIKEMKTRINELEAK